MEKRITFSVNVKTLMRIMALCAIILGGPILKSIGVIYFVVDLISHYTFKIEKKVSQTEETEKK